MELRAKNGPPPINPNDGVWLGGDAQWFTDQNNQRTVTLISNDTITQWDYVWVKIQTDIWCVAAEIRMFAGEQTQPSPQLISTGGAVLTNACNLRTQLNYGVVEVYDFRTSFELTQTHTVKTDLHIGFIHKGKSYNGTQDFHDVVGIGCYIIRRSSSTREGLYTSPWTVDPNAVSSGNIRDITQHYIHLPSSRVETLGAGFHEYSVWAGCHTSLLPLNTTSHRGVVEVLAEGADSPYLGRNQMCIDIKPTTIPYHRNN